MAQVKTENVHFKDSTGEKINDAVLYTTLFEKKDCMRRALKRLALFWLLALLSIPIVFAHWILVPGFFIFGPIAAYLVYKMKEAKDKASGVCPECNKAVDVKLEPKDLIPKWTYCPSCSNSLHIDY